MVRVASPESHLVHATSTRVCQSWLEQVEVLYVGTLRREIDELRLPGRVVDPGACGAIVNLNIHLVLIIAQNVISVLGDRNHSVE